MAAVAAAWQRWQCGGGSSVAVVVAVAGGGSAFERHQLADVHAFVLGRGRRDNGADCVALATAAPVVTITMATTVQTKPKATLMIPFVKLNNLLN